jgi:hypothetical protein
MMAKPNVAGQCGCGRSPTGKCIGWHTLTEEVFQEKLTEWNQSQMDESDVIEKEKAINEELELYRRQAMNLWFDNGGSCTGSSGTPNIN